MHKQVTHSVLSLVLFAIVASGCAHSDTEEEKQTLSENVKATIARFKKSDATMKKFFDSAYGYAVFPTVAKGGLVVGGAHGEGELFEQGKVVGIASLSQATIGAQIGGQGYSEIIFLKDKAAFNEFKSGTFALSAQASAVAAKAGASADADYESGVAIFTLAKGGLMAEASVGGQKFKVRSK